VTPTLQVSIETALARGTVYQCLAQACAYPGEAFTEALAQGAWVASLAEAVETLESVEACRETLQTLEIVQSSIDPTAFRTEYTRLFSNTALTDFPPYGADYLASHIFMKAQSLADVAGFYRAFGVGVRAGSERPDHISAELEFMGYLCFKEAYAADHGRPEALAVTVAAQRRFLSEHLGRWAPLFLVRFGVVSVQPFYRAMTAFARVFLAIEAMRLGVSPEAVFEVSPDAPAAGDFTCGVAEGQCPLAMVADDVAAKVNPPLPLG
jgi:putative dimethyl sulfoxide reductase chaperone